MADTDVLDDDLDTSVLDRPEEKPAVPAATTPPAAGVAPVAPKPAPVQAADPDVLDDDLDSAPAHVPSYFKKAAPGAKKGADDHWSITRGLVTGAAQAPGDNLAGVGVTGRLTGNIDRGSDTDKWLNDHMNTVPEGYKTQYNSLGDIHGIGDAIGFAGESVGQALGSAANVVAPTLVGAGIGAAAGLPEGGVGAVPGAVLGGVLGAKFGSVVPIYLSSTGQSYKQIIEDKGVIKALKDGTITADDVDRIAALTGTGVAAVEYQLQTQIPGAGKLLASKPLRAFSSAIEKRLITRMIASGGEMGLEEAAQEIMTEVGTHFAAGGKGGFDPAAISMNFLQGFIPGNIFGMRRHPKGPDENGNKEPPPDDTANTDPKTTSETAPAHGGSTPITDDKSTPGNAGGSIEHQQPVVKQPSSEEADPQIPGQTGTANRQGIEDLPEKPAAAASATGDQSIDAAATGEVVEDKPVSKGLSDAISRARAKNLPTIDPSVAAERAAAAPAETQQAVPGQQIKQDLVQQITDNANATIQQQPAPEQVAGLQTADQPQAVIPSVTETPELPAVDAPLTPEAAPEPALAQPAATPAPALQEPPPAEVAQAPVEEQAPQLQPEPVAQPTLSVARPAGGISLPPSRAVVPEQQTGFVDADILDDDLDTSEIAPEVRSAVAPPRESAPQGPGPRRILREGEVGPAKSERAAVEEPAPQDRSEKRAADVARRIRSPIRERLRAAFKVAEHDDEDAHIRERDVRRAVEDAIAAHAGEMGSTQHPTAQKAADALEAAVEKHARDNIEAARKANLEDDLARHEKEVETKAKHTVEARRAAASEHKAKLHGETGTGQEHARSRAAAGGVEKPSQAMRNEDFQTYKRRKRREAEALTKAGKPIPEELQKALDEFDWRKKNLKGRGQLQANLRAQSDARVQEMRDKEADELAAKEEPPKEEVPVEQEVEETKKAIETPKHELTQAERRRRAEAVDHSADENHLHNTIEEHPQDPTKLPRTEEGFAAAVEEHFRRFVKALEAKLGIPVADANGNAPTLNEMKSKAYNFVIEARKLLARKIMDPFEMFQLHAAVQADTRAQFYDGLRAKYEDAFSRGKPAIHENVADEPLMDAMDALHEQSASRTETSSDAHGITSATTGERVEVKPADITTLGKVVKEFADPLLGGTGSTRGFNWYRDSKGRWGGGLGLGKRLSQHLNEFLDKQIAKTLGNVRVYYVSNEQMAKLTGRDPTRQQTRGFWSEPSVAARVDGARGVIVLNKSMEPSEAAYIARHEAMHGFTKYAIDQNIDGFRDTLAALRKELWKAHPEVFRHNGVQTAEYQYGTKDLHEFVTEAYTNPAFQQLTAETPLSPEMQKRIAPNAAPGSISVWDAFVNKVASMIRAAIYGRQGVSLLEGIIRAAEPAFHEDADMQFHAAVTMASKPAAFGTAPRSPIMFDTPGNRRPAHTGPEHYGPAGSTEFIENVLELAQDKLADVSESGLSKWAAGRLRAMKNSTQLAESTRGIVGLTGIAKNAFEAWNSTVRRVKALAEQHMLLGNKVLRNFSAFGRKDMRSAAEVTNIYDQADHWAVDPSEDLGHKNNKHIGGGFTTAQEAAKYQALRQEFLALSPEAQAHFRAIRDLFGKRRDQKTTSDLKRLLHNARKKRTILAPPKGVTEEQRDNWILDGDIDRSNRVTRNEPRPELNGATDAQMMQSLGSMGGTLRDLSMMRRSRGVYLPRARRGNYNVGANRVHYTDATAPAGATVNEEDGSLIWYGKNAQKQARDYLSKTSDTIKSIDSQYVDPKTGKRVIKEETDAENVVIVQPQYDYYQQFDTRKEARQHIQDLRSHGDMENITDVRMNKTSPFEGRPGIGPAQQQRLINDAVAGIDDEHVKGLLRTSLTSAMMQANARSYMQKRGLKRKKVLGHTPRNMLQDIYEYNRSSSNELARMDMSAEHGDARDAAEKLVELHERRFHDGSGEKLRDIFQRMDGIYASNTGTDSAGNGLSKLSSRIRALSTAYYLGSPAYFAIQGLQPIMTTLPRISADYGFLNGHRVFVKASRVVGGWKQFEMGLGSTGNAIKAMKDGIDISEDSACQIIEHVRKQDPALAKVLEDARAEGLWGQGAGVEQELSEFSQGGLDKVLGRTMNVFGSATEAIENYNRTVSIAAAYYAAMNHHGKGGEEIAKQYAFDVVNETQGDYSDALVPAWAKSAHGKVFFQFKKYPQLMWRSIGGSMYRMMAKGSTAAGAQGRSQAPRLDGRSTASPLPAWRASRSSSRSSGSSTSQPPWG